MNTGVTRRTVMKGIGMVIAGPVPGCKSTGRSGACWWSQLPVAGRSIGDGERLARELGSYVVNNPDEPWSTIVRNTIDRFELRPGDQWSRDSDEVQRSEIASESFLDFDRDIWISFSVRTTEAAQRSWTVLLQLRAYDDRSDYSSRSPVFAHELFDDSLRVVTRADPTKTSVRSQPEQVQYLDQSFKSCEWHSFVYRVQVSRTGRGVLQAWRDGQEIVPSRQVPLGSNDQFGPQLKYGLYRSANPRTAIAEFCNVETSYGSLFSRVIAPLPVGSYS